MPPGPRREISGYYCKKSLVQKPVVKVKVKEQVKVRVNIKAKVFKSKFIPTMITRDKRENSQILVNCAMVVMAQEGKSVIEYKTPVIKVRIRVKVNVLNPLHSKAQEGKSGIECKKE